jgi:hypothetical protein
MKETTLGFYIPESIDDCVDIECEDCLYSREQPWKCFAP